MFNNVEELNSFDTIVMDDIVMEKIREKLYNTEKLMPISGILEEGVIKHLEYSKGITHYIYFKELRTNILEIQDYLYELNKKRLIHCFSGTLDYTANKDGTSVNILKRISNLKYGPLFMKSDKKDKERTIISVQATYLAIFGYIHLFQMDKEIRVETIEETKASIPRSSKNPTSNAKSKQTRKSIIHISELKVVTKNNPSIITIS